jgi:hypothetical protein
MALPHAWWSPTTASLAAPSNLRAGRVGGGPNQRINLSWTDNSNNEDRFIIERSTDSAFTSLKPFSMAANATSYTDGMCRQPQGLLPGLRGFRCDPIISLECCLGEHQVTSTGAARRTEDRQTAGGVGPDTAMRASARWRRLGQVRRSGSRRGEGVETRRDPPDAADVPRLWRLEPEWLARARWIACRHDAADCLVSLVELEAPVQAALEPGLPTAHWARPVAGRACPRKSAQRAESSDLPRSSNDPADRDRQADQHAAADRDCSVAHHHDRRRAGRGQSEPRRPLDNQVLGDVPRHPAQVERAADVEV